MKIMKDSKAMEVPHGFSEHGWERAYFALQSSRREVLEFEPMLAARSCLSSGFDVERLFKRRSLSAPAKNPIASQEFARIIANLYSALECNSALFAYVITNGVDGWRDDAYLLQNAPRFLRQTKLQPKSIQKFVQGQAWGDWPGLAIVLGIDWDYASEIWPDKSSDLVFFGALLDVGRIGHCLTVSALRDGIATRVTPAVAEAEIKDTLRITDERDPIHFIKMGKEV